MTVIATIEDAMITACINALKDSNNRSYVRTIETIPGGWTLETLKRMLQRSPGVYIAYLGGEAKNKENEFYIDGRFDAVIVNDAVNEVERRRGTKSQIGAYQIVERITPALHGLSVTHVGTLTVKKINNLFNEATFDLGATLYAVQCELPNIHLNPVVDDILDNFETFHIDYDIPPHEDSSEYQDWLQEPPIYDDSQPDAQDDVTLEQ